jgi:ferritin-like metal-binding protein YciE
MGHAVAGNLLKEILSEEKEADTKLTAIAQSANQLAERAR